MRGEHLCADHRQLPFAVPTDPIVPRAIVHREKAAYLLNTRAAGDYYFEEGLGRLIVVRPIAAFGCS